MSWENRHAYEVPGKLEIPYKYYAGETGSEFLTALRDKKIIMAARCDRCKVTYLPPRSVCSRCYKRIDKWKKAGPGGTVTSFTVVRYHEPHHPVRPPFIMALIKLDGADTAITHLLAGVEPEEARIGMRVEPVWADKRQARITDISHFAPAAAARPRRKKAGKKKTAKKRTGKKIKAMKKKTAGKKKSAKKAAKKKAAGKKSGRKK